ncbi:MAG: hypothetical protein IT288_09305 [Bdellovibrionales bacterium]|nr:hypothetical protein [Bdellovibrionales bacterium]
MPRSRPKFDKIERLIRLLKLQTTHTQDQIMDELGVENKNTFQDDASSLREGFRFLGWEITNTGRRPRESDYGSSVSLADSRFHPLFLCLNTTEVLKLFDALLSANDPIAEDLANFVWHQLSEPARAILKKRKSQFKPNSKIKLKNRQEREIYTAKNLDLFFVKPGLQKVQVELRGGHVLTGTLSKDGDDYFIKRIDGTSVPLNADDIVIIDRI